MKKIKIVLLILMTLFIIKSLTGNEKNIPNNNLKYNSEIKTFSFFDQSYSIEKFGVKIKYKNLSADTKLLLRNTILFTTLSIVPLGAGTGFLVGLIIWPMIDNYQTNETLVTVQEGKVPREVPGFILGAVFGSIMYAMGVFFIVMGVLNGIKYVKALKEEENIAFFMDFKYDLKRESVIETGISIKL